MKFKVLVVAGDGIGPEVTREATQVVSLGRGIRRP